MKTAARGAVLIAAPLLAAAPLLVGATAHADTTPTVDATCVMTAHGTFANAVDPGGSTDASKPNTLKMTGAVKCSDAAGRLVAVGSFERAATLLGEECTGDEHGDTANAVGASTGTGCGTQDGETAVDSTVVLRLTH